MLTAIKNDAKTRKTLNLKICFWQTFLNYFFSTVALLLLIFDLFKGDLTDEEAIMDFLASPEALELEDQIEEVNARQLEKLVKERPFVAVFFCKMFAKIL